MNIKEQGLKDHSVEETQLTTKLTIGGNTQTYLVYRIRLDKLYYNDQNDRIASFISQYANEHEGKKPSRDDIDSYNNIIEQFIVESNPDLLKKTKDNIKAYSQRLPGLVLADGRVIDGNRRFTCLRQLHKENPLDYQYFEAVILDREYENNEKQIKMLELCIQHGEDAKVDYDPIDKLIGVYKDVIKTNLITPEEYALSIGVKMSEFKKTMEQANLMIEFLEFANAPEQYYLARHLNIYSSLVDLANKLRTINDVREKGKLKNVVFSYLLLLSDNVTHSIRNVYKIKDTKQQEDFLTEQEDLVETLLDKLPEHLDVKGVESLRKDLNSEQEIENSIEKLKLKNKITSDTLKQIDLLNTAKDSIDSLNLNIVHKLKEEEKKEFNEILDNLINSLNELKDRI